MGFGKKTEKYKVVIGKDGQRYLKPDDRATEMHLAKQMSKQVKKTKKEKHSLSPEQQTDREHIRAMEKAYRQREREKKLKEKERKRKEWAKVRHAIKKTQSTSRETMNLSMFGGSSKSSKTKGKGSRGYVIRGGIAYPVAKKKKKKKSTTDDFKMPNWKDVL